MALGVIPTTKCWQLADYEFVRQNGYCTQQEDQQKQIAKHHLRTHGAHAPVNAALEPLIDLVRRLDRGLLSYENYSVPELMAFADARGIEYTQSRKPTQMALTKALERADDDARFTRMLDLPPELRIRVYESYFAGLKHYFQFEQESGCVPFRQTQVPITLTSRLIRRESLGVLHKCIPLLIELPSSLFGSFVNPPTRELDPAHFAASNAVNTAFRHLQMSVAEHDRITWHPNEGSRSLDVHIKMPNFNDAGGQLSVEVS